MPVTLLTPTAYARHRGCDEKSVRKAITAGRISTINGLVDPAVADIQWRQNTRARADSKRDAPAPRAGLPVASGEQEAAQYSVDRARRERYEADLAELKLRELQRDLVRVVEVRAEIAARVGNVRANLLQIPARLAPLLLGQADQEKVRALLEAEIRGVLTSLAAASAQG